MAFLTSQQRNTLEAAVKRGRKAAESGARNALHGMAVNNPEPFAHMSATQRALRNSLRSKARLLGDELPVNGAQKIDHLAYELAYETWHKMLFAKFLEANDLLMHTDGVAVTMDDCEELAAEEGYADKWDAAANYASRMLPAIFRPDDPLMQVPFATDDRLKLEGLIGSLDESMFTADDSFGWVYQFWQSEAKERINKSGDKIDGEKLPAVTQLFTEPYMVHFLVDNTLGAWWVSRNPGVKPPVKFEYLRYLPSPGGEGAGGEVPAAGKFEGWPDKTAAVTALDPCMGSGHFIASLFTVLAALRMQEEGLTKEEATDKVIAENLHGLELDPRCTQIGAFNLALTAWKFCGQYKELPEMNLACSGIAPKGKKEDWLNLVRKELDAEKRQRLENGMAQLYDHFQLAPELGSLIDPNTIEENLYTANFKELQPVLKRALENEPDTELHERGVMAAGIAKAGELLAKKYTLQITNVPYLARRRQSRILHEFCEKNYAEAKGELAAVFIDKMLKGVNSSGSATCVIPQNWLFQTSYRKFRERLLKTNRWDILVKLGPGAFSQITGEVVKPILISISKAKIDSSHQFSVIDVSDKNYDDKIKGLLNSGFEIINQKLQLNNPDARVITSEIDIAEILRVHANAWQGIASSDKPRFAQFFWEQKLIKTNGWRFLQGSVTNTDYYSGREMVLYWQDGYGEMTQVCQEGATFRGKEAWKKKGVMVSLMNELPCSLYSGELFDFNCSPVVPTDEDILPALWCFCSSPSFSKEMRKIDQKLNVTNSTLVKIPFDLEYWQKVAFEKYPFGLPKPYSDDPTQWLFHGHPANTNNPLQVALARLLGYRWPAESDTEMELADEARELITAVKAFDNLSDDDGVFCIPSVNGEQAGAERLRDYLQAVFPGWSPNTITILLQQEGATSLNLEGWLRNEFFIHHCKVFQNRPFIWHIWDGRKDGFSALVNYHKLNKEALSKLVYTYLGDWIRHCEAKKRDGESGAEGLLSAAQKLKEKLELILQGDKPYDIFVRWKPMEQQPIGWEPDLNDGVRLNIRPFIEADVLRKKPNIKWGVDRGKNPPGAPWGEVRDNDRHLTLEEKRKARENIKNQN